MWPAIIGAGAALLGGALSGNAAKSAARTSANAQLESARIAADAQRFRPVGITTRFGTSNFTTDEQGNVTGAGYTVAPELAAIQDRLLSQAGTQGLSNAGQALAAQQGLFNLGQQYLAQSPEQAAQEWMASQQALLAPARSQAQAGLTQNLFNTGRGGVAVAQGTGMGATNPEQQALLNAQAMQDLQLASQAQQQGMNRVNFGAGLFGTGAQVANAGYAPLQTQLGLGQTIEGLGQNALDIGAQLGGRSATAGANVGNTLLQGGLSAAKTIQGASGYSPVGDTLSGLAGNRQFIQDLTNWMKPTPTVDTSVVGYTGADRGLWF
jgi:hypothetical protein